MMDLSERSGRGDVGLHLPFVEEYLNVPTERYVGPCVPVEIPDVRDIDSTSFGHTCRELFYLSEEYTFLNHGALGCSLKASVGVSHEYQKYMDSQPLKVIDRELIPLLCHVTRIMADFVKCEPRDLILIENTTTGINTILRSLKFFSSDSILTLNIGYGAVGFAVDRVCELTGCHHVKVEIPTYISNPAEIVDIVSSSLNGGVKLAIFDYIPSTAAYVMPIKELIQLCNDRGILVLVDGAHSLGQVDLDLSSLGADFFVSNCHKWFCNARGSAIMYVKREHQSEIKPLVVSWGYGKGFSAEFMWSGTNYYSTYVALLSTIKFWQTVGPSKIMAYCSSVVKEAEKLCRKAWGVNPTCPQEMLGSMALVRLPDCFSEASWLPGVTVGRKSKMIQDFLYFDKKIEATIRPVGEEIFVRLSCHIYNQLSDFQKLADAVLEACGKRDQLVDHLADFYTK